MLSEWLVKQNSMPKFCTLLMLTLDIASLFFWQYLSYMLRPASISLTWTCPNWQVRSQIPRKCGLMLLFCARIRVLFCAVIILLNAIRGVEHVTHVSLCILKLKKYRVQLSVILYFYSCSWWHWSYLNVLGHLKHSADFIICRPRQEGRRGWPCSLCAAALIVVIGGGNDAMEFWL